MGMDLTEPSGPNCFAFKQPESLQQIRSSVEQFKSQLRVRNRFRVTDSCYIFKVQMPPQQRNFRPSMMRCPVNCRQYSVAARLVDGCPEEYEPGPQCAGPRAAVPMPMSDADRAALDDICTMLKPQPAPVAPPMPRSLDQEFR